MNYEPWAYQTDATRWILEHKRCGLFLEMGLGKTVITLTAVTQLLKDFDITRVLVIAPLRVAQTVWAEEAAKWDHLKHLKVTRVLGSRQTRLSALSGIWKDGAPSARERRMSLCEESSLSLSLQEDRLQKEKHQNQLRSTDLPHSEMSETSQSQTRAGTPDAMTTPTTAWTRSYPKPISDIYVINRENVPWLVETCAMHKEWPFDMIVIDELSSFKNPKAERFKALRRVTGLTRRIVGLTGTPSPNGLIDLWSQIYLLDRGERLGQYITKYREAYFRPGRTNGQVVFTWEPVKGAPEAIYQKLSDLCMSMTAEQYLNMPDRIDVEYPVELDSGGKRAYERLERDFVLPMVSETITAQNAAVLTGKLLQLANGAIYNEDGNYYKIHDAKLDALEDLIEAANGQPVLVYYSFKHDADRILERFPDARMLITAKDVSDWNAGQVPLMIAHPASAGHGLNLQAGGHILIWFGLTWSLELYQQANARLYRQGQPHPVTVYHVITKGTVDEDVLKVLTKKASRQDALIDALKARIDKYAG